MEKDKFLAWFNSSYRITGGASSLVSSDLADKWYDKWEETHRHMTDRVIKVEIDAESPGLTSTTCHVLMRAIGELIPSYFAKLGVSYSHLLHPTIKSPQKYAGWKWTKHIKGYLEKNNIDNITKAKVFKILADLGQEWAKIKIEKATYYLHLVADPIAFIRIGSYGCDSESCFRHGAVNEIHKFIIGSNPNSFMGFVSTKPQIDVKTVSLSAGTMECRFWGVEQDGAFHTCNMYPRYPSKGGNVLQTLEKGFQVALDAQKVVVSDNIFDVYGIYHNQDNTRTYHTPEFDADAGFLFNLKDDGLASLRQCISCRRSDNIQQVDRAHYCGNCASRYTTKCELTGMRTGGSLYSATCADGKIRKIAQRTLDREFKTSKHDGKYYHSSLVTRIDGKTFMLTSQLEGICNDCEHCGKKNAKDRKRCWHCRKDLRVLETV